ncbi:MAG: DNA polymerase I [Lachnospiraceae bacterium]|nr:DNA polymerase I [Lachnospiraceae bacterium]
MNKTEKLVLIDGHSILNRAFYGVPDLTNAEGKHTNAVFGFLNIMFKILDEEKPTNLAVAFDVKEPTFRHKMYNEYKGTRKPMPEELLEQVPLMKEVLQSMNIPIVELPGYEADDILGTLSKRAETAGMDVSIITGDRDLLQLATEHILIRIPKTKKGGTEIEDYHAKDVIETYQVTPLEFIDVKALMGDTADNIPGVPSVGVKTATSLIVQYKNIENLYAHIDEITKKKLKENLVEHKDSAELSKKLAVINIDSPVELQISDTKIKDFFTPKAYEYMKRLDFKSLLKRFDKTQAANTEISYQIVTDYDEVTQVFSKLHEMKQVAVHVFSNDHEIAAMALAAAPDQVYIIPKQWFITDEVLTEELEHLIFDDHVMLGLIGLKNHLKLVSEDSKDSSSVFDAEIAAYLLNPLKDTYHYDDIARDFLGLTVLSESEYIGKLRYVDAYEQNTEAFAKMAADTAAVIYQSMIPLGEQLKETNQYHLFTDIEMPLIFALNRMERAGVRVEEEELKSYSEMLGERIGVLEQEIYQCVDAEFNINSPKQLGEILFDKMGIPGGKKTKTGYSTSADILEKLAPEYPVIHKILEYRQMTKLKSTYADGLRNYIAPDGRIHGKFNQTITATGRISSTEPNLQNIPIRMELGRALRKVFVPKEGCRFIDADYSQIELRILAHISGDDNLIEAYKTAQDIHRITASKVFHTPFEEVTHEQRSNAKAVNFGIVYGISSFGLSQDLSITKKQAAEYIEQYFETYPKIKEFLDSIVEQARKDGYVSTLFGRRRPVPELSSKNFMQRSFGERIAMNSPIQGTAADIMKIAMINVDRSIREQGLKTRIVLQVHDELLLEVPEGEIPQVKELVENCMRSAANLSVPLEVGLESGDNWLEAH